MSRDTLKHIEHTISPANSRVKGRYNSTTVKEKATFIVRLTEFAATKAVQVTALVEDHSSGHHNIIFETPFLEDTGLTFNYSRGTISWDVASTAMKTIPPNEINSLNDEDPGDIDLPEFMKKATKKAATTFKANNFEKYNYCDMVLKCTHLSVNQQDVLIELFSQYEELFSGKLGSVPGPPVSLKLKSNAKPFVACAFTVLKGS